MTDPLIEDIARAILIARSWQTAVVGDWDEIEDAERDKYRAIAGAVLETPALQSRIAEVGRLETALTDARNNILSLLGGFRDDMPDGAVKLFQAQAKWIDAALSLQRRP